MQYVNMQYVYANVNMQIFLYMLLYHVYVANIAIRMDNL